MLLPVLYICEKEDDDRNQIESDHREDDDKEGKVAEKEEEEKKEEESHTLAPILCLNGMHAANPWSCIKPKKGVTALLHHSGNVIMEIKTSLERNWKEVECQLSSF